MRKSTTRLNSADLLLLTLNILCREVTATGIIPQGNRFGRPPIPVQCQVLAFVWFMSNSEVMRSVLDRFDFVCKMSITVGLELVKTTGEMQLEHEKPVGTFQPGKRDYLLSSSTFSGNFPVGRTEKTFFIWPRTGIFGIFDQMESALGNIGGNNNKDAMFD